MGISKTQSWLPDTTWNMNLQTERGETPNLILGISRGSAGREGFRASDSEHRDGEGSWRVWLGDEKERLPGCCPELSTPITLFLQAETVSLQTHTNQQSFGSWSGSEPGTLRAAGGWHAAL